MGQNRLNRIAALERSFTATDGQKMQVMITQNHLHTAVVFFGKFQGFQRLRAAIDNIADQPKGVRTMIKADFGKQQSQLVKTALNVSDCVMCHYYCFPLLFFSDGLKPSPGRLKHQLCV